MEETSPEKTEDSKTAPEVLTKSQQQAEKLYATEKDKAPETQEKTAEKTTEPDTEKKNASDVDEAVQKKEVIYELKIPEGSRLDQSWVERISADAKAKGLSQEEAQKILEDRSQFATDYVKGLTDQFQVERNSWQGLIEKDPVMGGAKFKETITYAEKGFKVGGSEKLKQILNETGYGDHPELVRWAAEVGKLAEKYERLTSEDKVVTGQPQVTPRKKTAAEILYGETNKSQAEAN